MEQVAEKPKKQTRGVPPLLAGAAVLGCVVLAAGLGVLLRRYGQSLNEKLFEERRLHLTEAAAHSADVLDETTQGAWHEVNACRRVLQTEGGELADGDSLLRLLASMQDVTAKDRSVVLAFDEQGNYYASDGNSGVWPDLEALDLPDAPDAPVDLANTDPDEEDAPSLPENSENSENSESDETPALYCRQAVAQLPHSGTGVYFLFLEPVAGVTLADTGSRVCYVAVALNSAVIRDTLSASGYGDVCGAYLADKDGRLLYQYTTGEGDAGGEETLAPGADLAAAVSAAPYAVLHGDSFAALGTALREGGEETRALEFVWPAAQSRQSQTPSQIWFAANAAVGGMGWNLVLFVPAAALGVGARDILAETIRFFTAASGIVLLALLLLWRLRRARRAAKRAQRQAACVGMRKSC
jgi:hypothetical protein